MMIKRFGLGLALLMVAATALAGGQYEPSFPGVPTVPTPPGVDYGGFFKAHQPVNIVFGVSDPGRQLKESLVNAAYTIKYLKPRGIPYHIQIVIYGAAVNAANSFTSEYGGYAPLLETLHEKGVQFMVCNNSLHAMQVPADNVYHFMKIIPAGILQIAKMQMQGYTYISNH